MCLNIKPYIVSSWVGGQSCLEKLNCVDGGPKSIKKQKNVQKRSFFLRITASLTYFFGNFDPRDEVPHIKT